MMVDAEVMPYQLAEKFEYRGDWTGRLFTPLRMIVRSMCNDSHEELKECWSSMIENDDLQNEEFLDLSQGEWPSVSYEATGGRIRSTMKSRDQVSIVRMQREIGEFFRENYHKATADAKKR